MIPIKSEIQIQTMRQGGKILAQILNLIIKEARSGTGTKYLDSIAEKEIRNAGGWPAFKGYGGFPSSICTCFKDEIVHAPAIPNRILQNEDLLTIDIGMRYPKKNGMIVDMAKTIPIGKITAQEKKLLQVTKEALDLAIKKIKPGIHLGVISNAIQELAEKNNFNVIRDLVGHGVGEKLHEEPEIPNFGSPNNGPILKSCMTLAIEPMITMGNYEIILDKNKQTYKTKDGLACAHFEHTVLVTENGSEVLTK